MGSNSLRIERRGRVTLLTTDRLDVAFAGRSSLCSPVSILAKKEGAVPNRLAKSRCVRPACCDLERFHEAFGHGIVVRI